MRMSEKPERPSATIISFPGDEQRNARKTAPEEQERPHVSEDLRVIYLQKRKTEREESSEKKPTLGDYFSVHAPLLVNAVTEYVGVLTAEATQSEALERNKEADLIKSALDLIQKQLKETPAYGASPTANALTLHPTQTKRHPSSYDRLAEIHSQLDALAALPTANDSKYWLHKQAVAELFSEATFHFNTITRIKALSSNRHTVYPFPNKRERELAIMRRRIEDFFTMHHEWLLSIANDNGEFQWETVREMFVLLDEGLPLLRSDEFAEMRANAEKLVPKLDHVLHTTHELMLHREDLVHAYETHSISAWYIRIEGFFTYGSHAIATIDQRLRAEEHDALPVVKGTAELLQQILSDVLPDHARMLPTTATPSLAHEAPPDAFEEFRDDITALVKEVHTCMETKRGYFTEDSIASITSACAELEEILTTPPPSEKVVAFSGKGIAEIQREVDAILNLIGDASYETPRVFLTSIIPRVTDLMKQVHLHQYDLMRSEHNNKVIRANIHRTLVSLTEHIAKKRGVK